jgi:hypothetical protein
MQRTSPKKTIKKIFFLNYKMHFFPFWPLLFHQCIMFSSFVQIEGFKLLWNRPLKLYKYCNFKGNRVIFKDFLRGSEIGYELFNPKFSIKTTPLTSGGRNFLTSYSILAIFSVINVPWGESSIYSLDTINNGAFLQKRQANPTLSDDSWAILPYSLF